jgi:hypothetical protein
MFLKSKLPWFSHIPEHRMTYFPINWMVWIEYLFSELFPPSVLVSYYQMEDEEPILARTIPHALILPSHIYVFNFFQTGRSLTDCPSTMPWFDIAMFKIDTGVPSFSLIFVLGTFG